MEQVISDSQQENKPPKPSQSGKIVLIILLLLSWGIIAWLYLDSTKKIEDCTENYTTVSGERERLLSSLDSLEQQYKSLMTNNDSINAELELKIKEVKKLKNKVWRMKVINDEQVKQFEATIETMRDVARSYVDKIDSLNTANLQLIETNTVLKTDLEQAQKVDQEKTKQLEELTTKVELASVLKATAIISLPLNKRSKPIFKAKKVTRIKTSATILENKVVEIGEKTVYIRIIRNDGVILATSAESLFKYEGEEILYSAKKEITYNQNDMSFEIFYDANDDIITGSYKVKLFCDEKEIGETSFILK